MTIFFSYATSILMRCRNQRKKKLVVVVLVAEKEIEDRREKRCRCPEHIFSAENQ